MGAGYDRTATEPVLPARRYELTILLTGPPGLGKSMLAQKMTGVLPEIPLTRRSR
jgi:predicted ATPase with chaperone activity